MPTVPVVHRAKNVIGIEKMNCLELVDFVVNAFNSINKLLSSDSQEKCGIITNKSDLLAKPRMGDHHLKALIPLFYSIFISHFKKNENVNANNAYHSRALIM